MKRTNSKTPKRLEAERRPSNGSAAALDSRNGSSPRPGRRPAVASGNNHGSKPMRQAAARPPARVFAGSGAEVQVNHLGGRRNPQYSSALRNFDTASRFFRKQEYQKAKEIFEKLAATAPPELAERAGLHLRLCQSRMRRPGPLPKTAADCYVMGVAELNSRNLDSAIGHLGRADKLEPEREDVHYALAAAHALQGNLEEALTHVRVTVALRPANSFQIRQDEDFASLVDDPRFRELLYAGGGPNPPRRS